MSHAVALPQTDVSAGSALASPTIRRVDSPSGKTSSGNQPSAPGSIAPSGPRPRSGPATDSIGGSAIDPAASSAAIRGLTLALEIIDRRRNPDSLKPYAGTSLVHRIAMIALGEAHVRSQGSARLHRVHLRADGRTHAVEVCATYRRGNRIYAIAGRVDKNPAGRWLYTALQLL